MYNFIVFVLFLFGFDVGLLLQTTVNPDESLFRQRRNDEPIINPIWITKAPKSSMGNTSQFFMNYGTAGAYYVEMQVGNPSKPFKMLISSSAESSTLRSSRCTDCVGTLYDGDQSKSVKGWNETTDHAKINTVGGEYEGTFIKDRITSGELIAFKVKILAATKGSSEATKGQHDGVLSFKYQLDDRGFFQRLIEIEHLKKTIVTFVFLKNRQNKVDEKAGIVWLGTRNPDYFTEPMGYSYINSEYWVIGLQSLMMGDVEFCADGPCLGHVNLDDEFVLIHQTFYDIFLQAMDGKPYEDGKIIVDCEGRSMLPPIRFQVGGEKFKLSGDEYTIKIKNEECVAMFKMDPRANELAFIFGTHFYEHFYLELGLYKFGKAVARGVGIAKRKYIIT